MRVCGRCGRENEDSASNCVRCGTDLNLQPKVVIDVPTEPPMYCYRHPKVETQLQCGRCERPVCTKCVVLGPAGPRCPECARNHVPVRPAAIAHEVKRGFSGLFASGNYMKYWIIIALLGLMGGAIKSCSMLMRPSRAEPEYEQPSDQDQEPPSRTTRV